MALREWITRLSIVGIIVLSLAVGTTPARAAGQTITQTVLLASNGGGVARREWNASGGTVNGVNGWVFAVDPSEVGTYFTLNQDGANSTTRILLVGRSTDGGATWHNKVVYAGPLGTSIQNLFPVVTVDHQGNVYAAFSTQLPDGSLMGVYLTMSSDGGKTWTPIQRVSPSDQTAVFPAVASGDDGKVDLVWIGTPATSPGDPSAQWNIYFAQSRDADDGGSAKWSIGQISTHVMHVGDICDQGLNCNIFGGNRDLADFISVAVDADGDANAVWTDDASQSPKAIMFAKQITGPRTGRLPPES